MHENSIFMMFSLPLPTSEIWSISCVSWLFLPLAYFPSKLSFSFQAEYEGYKPLVDVANNFPSLSLIFSLFIVSSSIIILKFYVINIYFPLQLAFPILLKFLLLPKLCDCNIIPIFCFIRISILV